jgi:hypothetical protein
VAVNDRTFLNQQSGTFTETSREWIVYASQWMQTYYQLRDGKLYLVENDNKEQTHVEEEVDVAAFLSKHAATRASPWADIVAFFTSGPSG